MVRNMMLNTGSVKFIMVMESLHWKTAVYTMVNGRMVSNMAEESANHLMAVYTLVNGKMESNMAEEC
jgi:hypothetical protein